MYLKLQQDQSKSGPISVCYSFHKVGVRSQKSGVVLFTCLVCHHNLTISLLVSPGFCRGGCFILWRREGSSHQPKGLGKAFVHSPGLACAVCQPYALRVCRSFPKLSKKKRAGKTTFIGVRRSHFSPLFTIKSSKTQIMSVRD